MQGSQRDTIVKNRLLDCVGEGEGRLIWENNIEACVLPYVKQMTSASSMYEAGHPNPVLWNNPEGRIGKEGGRGVQDEGDMCTHGWLMSMSGKNQHNIVK